MRERVRDLEPTINQALAQYAGGNVSPVVRDRARIIAAKALADFDPKRGASPKTHVMNQLRRLQREVPVISDPLPMPERFRRDQGRIAEVIRQIEEHEGREALPEEIADTTHLSRKRVRRVMDRMAARVSQTAYEDTDGDDDDQMDVVTDRREPWDEWVDMVYAELPERDRLIFRHRTGYDGSPILDNNTLARQLNISPQIVSQRARVIQGKLDRFR